MNVESARRRARELAYLHAFISLGEDQGEGPAVAVKDLLDVRGMVTTGGGVLLPNRPAKADAAVVAAMRESGAAVVGKTNLHEWAYGVTSLNPHYGAVVNPRDPRRVAGGSSGGSAVAVATRMCDWAIGTDTGGSIRIPAAFCGVVGFKPSLGALSTDGVFPLSRSLDTVGPLAPDVTSAYTAFLALAGGGPAAPAPVSAPRLAVPAGWLGDLDPATAAAWALLGAGLPEVPFPDRERMARAGDVVLSYEASRLHRDWIARRPQAYGGDVLARLRRGLEIGAGEYSAALQEREQLAVAAEQALAGWDALLLPAVPQVAPLIEDAAGERLRMTRGLTEFTRPFNTSGQPVFVLPAPVAGVPVGIQVVGRRGQEAALAGIALALELEWGRRRPPAAQE